MLLLATNDHFTSPLYPRLVLKRQATSFCEESEKHLIMFQKKYNSHDDHHAWFAWMFKKFDEVYMDGSSVFHTATEKSTVEGYNKLFRWKQVTYKVVGVKNNTLQILKVRLKNTMSMHQATLATTSRRYVDETNREDERTAEKEQWCQKTCRKPPKMSTSCTSLTRLSDRLAWHLNWISWYDRTATELEMTLLSDLTTCPGTLLTLVGGTLTSAKSRMTCWAMSKVLAWYQSTT